MVNLTGKIAFVTGAAMGNGKGIAQSLIRQGATVILADKSENVYDTAKELGKNAYAYLVDITDSDAVKTIVNNIILQFEKIDILVNNAGIARFAKFVDATDEIRDMHFNINLVGSWICAKEIVPYMIKQKNGRIVNMSSVTGPYVADPGEVAYATSKAAIIGFTKALAIEMAEYGITVNALCPGYILTPMVMKSARESNPKNPQSVIDNIAAGIPLKHLGSTKNVGDLVAFLASDEAEYITGQAITIDGGNGLPETNAMGLK